MVLRFDDVSLNSDLHNLHGITDIFRSKFPNAEILYAVSPLVHDCGSEPERHSQRIYPRKFNAMSDWKQFLRPDFVGIPAFRKDITSASHGLIHCDHRLLSRDQQEMSILISCSLVKSNIFVPPYNKWNKITEEVCKENRIDLIKFEDGWLSMEHNKFAPDHKLWYLHDREFTKENFIKYIENDTISAPM